MVAVNVLEDSKIREEIKLMTEWPTIPQVFVGGTFVGGCDIMFEMNRNGDLEKLLRKHKLIETE